MNQSESITLSPIHQDNSIYDGRATRVFQDEVELRLGNKRNNLIGVVVASNGIHIARRIQLLWNKSLDMSDDTLEAAEFIIDMKPRKQVEL